MLKGIFFGSIGRIWSTSAQRLDAIRSIGVAVRAVDTDRTIASNAFATRLRRRFASDPYSVPEVRCHNELVLSSCQGQAPDFAWFEWPRLVEAATLLALKERWPNCLLVCFQDDNPFGDRIRERPLWRRFIKNIPFYDLHFVKRDADIVEFTRLGARRVLLFTHGVYDPLFRPDDRPLDVRKTVWPVSFVGTALDHRVGFITQLFKRYNIPVRVFGCKWRRTWVALRHWRHFSTQVTAEAYTRVIWNSKISLGFLSSSNHDEYAGRTFEIPGSGGFFLAERTQKHQEFFEEAKEAEFFSSVEECASKIRFYLANDNIRRRIAAAGYERCMRSDYLLTSRMRDAMRVLFPDNKL